MEYTFSMIKPDATARNLTGKINSYIEAAGFTIVAQKRARLTVEQAQQFYAVHSARPFFASLIEGITAGPVILQVLRKESNAVMGYRTIMGATNPADAEPGTIRKDFAVDIEANSVHGSDSAENAKIEIGFFFSQIEIIE
jgi:nucleoside-diphosphate kinase